MASPAQKRVNVVVSRLIPPVLLGAVVYASYAVTKPLCSEFGANPVEGFFIKKLTM
jgi:palmitoyltransferase